MGGNDDERSRGRAIGACCLAELLITLVIAVLGSIDGIHFTAFALATVALAGVSGFVLWRIVRLWRPKQ